MIVLKPSKGVKVKIQLRLAFFMTCTMGKEDLFRIGSPKPNKETPDTTDTHEARTLTGSNVICPPV